MTTAGTSPRPAAAPSVAALFAGDHPNERSAADELTGFYCQLGDRVAFAPLADYDAPNPDHLEVT